MLQKVSQFDLGKTIQIPIAPLTCDRSRKLFLAQHSKQELSEQSSLWCYPRTAPARELSSFSDHYFIVLHLVDLVPEEDFLMRLNHWHHVLFYNWGLDRVAELGSLSSGAKMAMKIFVKHIYWQFSRQMWASHRCVVLAHNRNFAILNQ